MNQVCRWLVWLSRIHRCRGFGIQSPNDYGFVRYVVNEHWPYYAYDKWQDVDWLHKKLGKLYFRLANWRQPSAMLVDEYKPYWHAGCRRTRFVDDIDKVELARVTVENSKVWDQLLAKCNEQSVIVVEGIWRNWTWWHEIERDERIGTTFDLYYCGIVFFDKNRYKHHYSINF